MKRVLSLVLLSACGPKEGVEPLAARAELAPAAAVFERHLRESTHGEPDRMRSIRNSRTRMRMDIPSMGMSAQSEMWWVAPHQMLVTTTMEGLGEIVQGYDGERGWMEDPTMGPRLLEGEELIQAKFQADPFGDLDYATRYSVLETVRQTELAGEPVWEVKAVPMEWENEVHYFFSISTGLLVGSEQEVASPLGKMKATSQFSDYRDVEGLLSPFRMEQKVMGMSQIILVESIEYNLENPPEIAVPAELQ